MKVKGRVKSTSRVPDFIAEKTYLQAKFDDLETVVLEKNDALYRDAFLQILDMHLHRSSKSTTIFGR